jgi:hypothetical protein
VLPYLWKLVALARPSMCRWINVVALDVLPMSIASTRG